MLHCDRGPRCEGATRRRIDLLTPVTSIVSESGASSISAGWRRHDRSSNDRRGTIHQSVIVCDANPHRRDPARNGCGGSLSAELPLFCRDCCRIARLMTSKAESGEKPSSSPFGPPGEGVRMDAAARAKRWRSRRGWSRRRRRSRPRRRYADLNWAWDPDMAGDQADAPGRTLVKDSTRHRARHRRCDCRGSTSAMVRDRPSRRRGDDGTPHTADFAYRKLPSASGRS